MSMTLYFAKLNLVSDNIFELYDNPNQRNAISRALYEAINANKIWEKENLFIDANGEQRSTITEYSTHILRVDDTYSYIEGWLYKKSKLYYKTLNSMTNTLVQQSTENTEGNRFALDLKHGFVGYNTSARFGYKEFIEAFENIIETKNPEKSRQKAAGCRNTQEVIYTQPLFITPFYLLKGYRSDRLDINIPVIPKAARRDGFTR